jgi:hypothetical protein
LGVECLWFLWGWGSVCPVCKGVKQWKSSWFRF